MWSDFQMQKAEIIRLALKNEPDTLFLDADMLILDVIDDIDVSKQIGVSPHFMMKKKTKGAGYYNGGMLWTNQKSLPDNWIKFTKTSRYYDQASIEDLVKIYDKFEFDENYNIGWWRWKIDQNEKLKNNFTISKNKNQILYKKKPCKILHTHFNRKSNNFNRINKLFICLFHKSKNYKLLMIIERILAEKWIIELPRQPMKGKWKHVNDSFRKLIFMLREKNKDLSIKLSHKKHIWLTPHMLLFDRPTNKWFDEEAQNALCLLLGNGNIEKEGKLFNKHVSFVFPWIFWPRHPEVLEKLLNTQPYLNFKERKHESIFIGNYKTPNQIANRTKIKWENVIKEFHCTSGKKHKFTQEKYLEKLKLSQYGLCLRGEGSKCHREVELMALGTVPIITPAVSINSYTDPPIENVHYLKVDKPDEVSEKIKHITQEEWEKMSQECQKWYQRNIHSDNCFNTMISNIFYSSG